MSNTADVEEQIVVAIRRIVRAIDQHSRRLVEAHGLTGPQLTTLREVSRREGVTAGALARAVRLSQPTVSGILDRLVRQNFVSRQPSPDDRRAMLVTVTEKGADVLRNDPSLLQDRFRAELERIEEWERLWILSALERIAAMMDAEAIDAAPMLVTGPITASAGSASSDKRTPAGNPGTGTENGQVENLTAPPRPA